MKPNARLAMGVIMLSLLLLKDGIRAQDSREVLEVIRNTAARSAPGASSKYMSNSLRDSLRSVDSIVQRNRGLNITPSSSMLKNASTSSRRYLSTPSIDAREKVYGRLTQEKVTAFHRKVPRSQRDPTYVELGRKAGRLVQERIASSRRNLSQSQLVTTDINLSRKVGRLTKEISSRKNPVDFDAGRNALKMAAKQPKLKNDTIRIGREVQNRAQGR